MTRLVPRPLKADPDGLPSDWHPVVRRVLAARGISRADQLDMGLHRLASPAALADCDEAARCIAATVRDRGRILVLGDFDADGATSCALAVRALRAMGAREVDYLVPDRFAYGYGLSPAIAEVARERQPALVITVDNGITSHDGAAALKAAGIPVVITDHHLPGDGLPPAAAIVNPNRADDGHPGKALAGVGVIFHVMLQVRAVLREQAWFGAAGEPGMAELLDLVALGTVADLVPLDATNRILAEQGLRRIRSGAAAPGILALLAVAGRQADRINTADLGFAVAPRLNAAGRLDDMAVGIECLLTDDRDQAASLAERLDDLNRDRRAIESRMRDDAMAAVESLRERLGDSEPPAGLCLHSADWHEGVVGLVAGRVKEHFHRPVVALAPTGDGSVLKGSGRSIPGVHIRDVLTTVDARYPGIMERFGGHAMAAGLSLRTEQQEAFREAFQEVVAESVSPEILANELAIDGALEAPDFTLGLACTLRTLVPWGEGFPEPRFSNAFRIRERRVVGGRHLKLRVTLDDSGPVLDAIAFNALDRGWSDPGEKARLTYRLDVNRYRGRDRLQLVVDHIQY